VPRYLIAMLVVTLPAIGQAQEPELAQASKELFVVKCSSCHSVGGGDRVGPDLKDATTRRQEDWVRRMINAPSRMLDSDPDARALVSKYKGVRMPDLGLTAEQVDAMVTLIAFCSANPCDLAPKLTPVTQATPQDAALGRELFLGVVAFKGGGPACVSCHTVEGVGSILDGGLLSKDLTNVFARLGDVGLEASLRNPTFLLMNKVFADHPLAADETFPLRAFLYDANRGALPAAVTAETPISVPLAGAVGAAVALILLNALWPRRLRGIRKPLVHPTEKLS